MKTLSTLSKLQGQNIVMTQNNFNLNHSFISGSGCGSFITTHQDKINHKTKFCKYFQRCRLPPPDFITQGNTYADRDIFKCHTRTSLVEQWLRIYLPMQGTWVQALVQEDPTCRGATKPVRHSY